MRVIELDGEHLTLEDVAMLAAAWATPGDVIVTVASDALEKVDRARKVVERILSRGEIVYGITTGFGDFKDRIIPPGQVRQLQRNIVISHAVGVGPLLDHATVRALMAIRLQTLVKGHSGVRSEVVETLAAMVNKGVYPVIPAQGSLGASGDLAPLAHMTLVMLGEGEAFFEGERLSGTEAMHRAQIDVIRLEAKEGLALTNGTTLIAAIGALAVVQAEMLSQVADIAAAMSLEALHGTPIAFDERIHAARPHAGQIACAANIRRLIAGSQLTRAFDPLDIQDAYSLRCTPQVHGAARDVLAYARRTLEIELNSANDNPLIFVNDDGSATTLSGGNFHGEPVGMPMDFLKVGLSELASISERRLARLVDEKTNKQVLPAFLTQYGGLNSGFMLVQYTSAALVSENKVLAHPATVDSIPSSANTEDHVSMGTVAARQAGDITRNLEYVLTLELFAAAQGIDYHIGGLGNRAQLGRGTAHAYQLIRSKVPFIERDTVMYPQIETLHHLVASGELAQAVEQRLADE
jgi:histidine ammonia-lyase